MNEAENGMVEGLQGTGGVGSAVGAPTGAEQGATPHQKLSTGEGAPLPGSASKMGEVSHADPEGGAGGDLRQLSTRTLETEAMLLAAADITSTTVRRVRRRQISDSQYTALIEWAGSHLRIVRGLSTNTVANYIDDVALCFEWLNERGLPLEQMTAAVASEWQRHLYLQNRDRSRTRDLKLVSVRRFYAWREQEGHGPNPLRELKGPRREKPVPKKFTTGELQRLFRSCDPETRIGLRDRAVLLFIYATGARRMECASLQLSQLTLHERVGRVQFRGKGAKERVVSFEGLAVDVLRDWLLERDKLATEDDAVFVGVAGGNVGRALRINGFQGIITRAASRGKVSVAHLHRLRCTFATDLYDSEVDIETIRSIMGHDSIETTRRYIDISDRRLRTRLPGDRLAEVMGQAKRQIPLWMQRGANHGE